MSAQIVGVVADAVLGSPRDVVPPMWYLPISQFTVSGFPFSPVRLSVRAASGSPALLTRSVAAATTAVNPNLALTFRPLAEQVHGSLVQQRLMAQVAGFFGAVALLLAGLGLYGVASYAVSCRRSEIPIH
jgi:putative ABC transport system permease protein